MDLFLLNKKQKMTKIKKIALVALLALPILFLSGCGCKKAPVKQYSLNLEIWGLFDDSDVFSKIFDEYKKTNPNIESITYKKLSPDTYEKELLEALASEQGPDIFLVRNVWLREFADKLSPAPADIVNEKSVKEQFVDVVDNDFVSDGNVYALPLSVDSLALFYNKDIFNKAGLTYPPKNWEDFTEDVKRLTQIDEVGNIEQAGAAIGTGYNINRSVDILSLLLLQNNGKNGIYNDDYDSIVFDSQESKAAFEFYTQFANSKSPFYSWNPRMHYSIDAFSEGNVAMMFNYSWQIPVLQSKSPKLNFAVSEIPQQKGAANKIGYANYWGFGVSKKQPQRLINGPASALPVTNEARIQESWKLLKFMTMAPEANPTTGIVSSLDPAIEYAQKTGKPSGRRDIIDMQSDIPNTSVFSLGNLYAASWPQFDANASDVILADTIEQIVSGETTVPDGIRSVEARINNLKKQ